VYVRKGGWREHGKEESRLSLMSPCLEAEGAIPEDGEGRRAEIWFPQHPLLLFFY
jgi:hypothetical protein